MKFPVTFAGQLKFPLSTVRPVVVDFLRALLIDLELAKSNRVLQSFSVRNYSVRFLTNPISRRFLKHPLGYFSLLSYPNHYRQFIQAISILSKGEFVIEQIEDAVVIKYRLNFTEIFRWAIFVFTGCLLFGASTLFWGTRLDILLIGFCILSLFVFGFYYGLGVLGSIVGVRRYLKNLMRQIVI